MESEESRALLPLLHLLSLHLNHLEYLLTHPLEQLLDFLAYVSHEVFLLVLQVAFLHLNHLKHQVIPLLGHLLDLKGVLLFDRLLESLDLQQRLFELGAVVFQGIQSGQYIIVEIDLALGKLVLVLLLFLVL